MELDGWQPALDAAAALLARARQEGTKVIHVINDGGEGTPYDIRAEIGRIHPARRPGRRRAGRRQAGPERLRRYGPGPARRRRRATATWSSPGS